MPLDPESSQDMMSYVLIPEDITIIDIGKVSYLLN